MQTTYIGQEKFIVRGARHFRATEASMNAATQAEWAEKILAAPAITWQNGRNSHEAAGEILERAEDVLLDHMALLAA